MCNKGNPSTTSSQTTNQSGTATTNQSGTSSGQQAGTNSQVLGPTPETLALYQALLNQANMVQQTPFNNNTLMQSAPWTDAMNQGVNAQFQLGQQGMGFVPQAAGMIGQGGQSTIGQIPGVAASILSPWAGQAVDFGTSQGQKIADWSTGQAQNIQAMGPQLQQFSKAAIDQYQSPYTQDVVNATQDWFNNQNGIQSNQLIGQGIKQGNVFGGDRAGVAQGVLAGQQQLAQAPVIAGLYNQGYAQALAEFNTQNQLAAQLQEFGAQLGQQGLTAQGQLGMAGLGLGLNASTAANQQAIGALGQNQQAALQAGQLFGNLGATQYQQNLAGGQQSIAAAGMWPAFIQNQLDKYAANSQQIAAYPFQTTSWYGGLLGGLGPLTGSQQAGSNASATQQQQNQIATQISNQIANQNGITTPPQPNQFVQAAGLGLAGLGLFAKDGGRIPRMAEGGGVGPYGGQHAPYGKARSYVQDSGMRPGRLKAPDVPGDKPLTLQSLGRALTFMNLGNVGSIGPKAAAASNAAGGGTLGQLSSLLKTEGAKGAAGSLSSFFGGGGSTINVSDPVGTGSIEVLKRGGMVNRYENGGWEDDEEQDIPEAAQYTAGEMSSEDDSVPLPRRRPAEAGASALDFTGDEPYNVSSPEQLAVARAADRNLTPEMEGGSPSGQAGVEAAPGFTAQRPAQQGGLGQGRWLMQGSPRKEPGLMQRWAASPLTQIGLGLASQNSPTALGGIGQGLARAMPMIQRQHALDQRQEALDSKATIDNSGMTQVVKFADGRIWDTRLATPKALQLAQKPQQQRYGRIPTGYRMTATGELERVPGGPPEKATTSQGGPTMVPEAAPPTATAPAAKTETAAAEEPFRFFTPEAQKNPPEKADLLRGTPVKDVNPAVLEAADKYSPGMGDLIKAISEGRTELPKPSRNPNSYSQALIGYLHQYDKKIDQTVYPMRQRTANEFAVGMAGKNLVAVNTLGTHMLEFHTLSSEMKEAGYPSFNALRNAVTRQGFANERQQALLGRWDIVQKAVADEGAKVFAGQQSALADRTEWLDRLSPNNPEPVLKEKLQALTKLVGGRVQSLADQYNRGMRANYTEKDFMSPQTRNAYDTIMAYEGPSGLGGKKGKEAPATGTAAPAQGTRKQFKQGWGVWDGSKWVPE